MNVRCALLFKIIINKKREETKWRTKRQDWYRAAVTMLLELYSTRTLTSPACCRRSHDRRSVSGSRLKILKYYIADVFPFSSSVNRGPCRRRLQL